MDFEFSDEQGAFAAEVEAFLDANADPDVFDLSRENMAQLVDTPERRAFMKEMGRKGWLGITWPAEYGGSEGEGVYEYLLNEALAARGGPQIGKGVGIVGKTIIAHGSEKLKAEFLPMILENDVEFAVGYSEPDAGSDAASMRLRAERHTADDGTTGWLLNGEKTWTTSAHFAEWYWLGTRTDPDNKHMGITLMLVPLDQPGITIDGIWTMGDERTNSVFLDNVFVPDDYVVGDVNHGFRYISQALDLERFTLFTFSPIKQRLDLLTEWVQDAERDGEAAARGPQGAGQTRQPAHRGRGGQSARPEVRGRGGEGRARSSRGQGGVPAADGGRLGIQALRHRAIEAPGRRVHGHRRTGIAAAGAHRGRPDGGPLGVDLPLHGDRHHRGRRLGDPEEHHRPAGPRPTQELLSAFPWRQSLALPMNLRASAHGG